MTEFARRAFVTGKAAAFRLNCVLLCLVGALWSCEPTQSPLSAGDVTRRVLLFGDRVVAESIQEWDPVGPMLHLHHQSESNLSPGVVTQVNAWLGTDGSVFQATWSRTDPKQTRRIHGLREGDVVLIQEADGPVRQIPILGAWVLPETVFAWQGRRQASATLLDLSGGEYLTLMWQPNGIGGRFVDDQHSDFLGINNDGVRIGPGAFQELAQGQRKDADRPWPAKTVDFPHRTMAGRWRLGGVDPAWRNLALDGPAQQHFVIDDRVWTRHDPNIRDKTPPSPLDYLPTVGIESDHPAIRRFSEQTPATDPFGDAWRLAQRIHAGMVFSERGGPPSALATLATFAGDCDNATALLVAALRAQGHAARAVVGYRIWKDVLSPHAWAEVYTGEEWKSVDPSIPAKGPLMTHLRLFEGLGSSLSMGRVLGRLEVDAFPID